MRKAKHGGRRPNSGRPSKYKNSHSTSIRLPSDLWKQLKKVADERNISVNQLIVERLAICAQSISCQIQVRETPHQN
jgi:predicted DNA-binding ribbon-helix-helix protein